MVDIKCQTVGSKKTPKETGLDVECSLERGLYCRSKPTEAPCADFEISVLCRCNPGDFIFILLKRKKKDINIFKLQLIYIE